MLESIFWLLTWPALIVISYHLIIYLVRKYEEKK